MAQETLSRAGETLLIDAHVHFHRCFETESFLLRAARNFDSTRRRLDLDRAARGVLLLTESEGADFFERCRRATRVEARWGWRLRVTAEEESLVAQRDDDLSLTLVAGRQLETAEALEVLALGCTAALPRRVSIRETIESVRRAGALAVVPWGFGKWWFGRGRRVAELLGEQDPSTFFLGDNSGRPRYGRRPAPFRLAEQRGFRVLPGTDPLPLPGQAERVASYGFVLRGPIDPERPAAGIKALLRDRRRTVEPFGSRERLVPFLRNQVKMQRLKLFRGRAR